MHITSKKNRLQKAIYFIEQAQLMKAEKLLSQILINDSLNFDALYLKGVVCGMQSRHEDCKSYLLKALSINPNHAFLRFNLAKAMSELGEDGLALEHHQYAVGWMPKNYQAWLNFGKSLHCLEQFNDALNCADKAIELKNDSGEAYTNRGLSLKELHNFQEALVSFDKAIELNSAIAEAHLNRGVVLHEFGLYDEALSSYQKAIEIKSEYPDAYNNKGLVLVELKRLEEALMSYLKAIELRPNYDGYYFNYSFALLLHGELEKGFALFEYRWKADRNLLNFKSNYSQPLWLGKQSILNKTILLWSEQGLGDTIQFCRYTKLIKSLGARVLLQVPKKIVALLDGLDGVDLVVENDKTLSNFEYQCPLISLPLALNTTIESIPRSIPYINIDISRQNLWRECLGNSGFKIAICWQGSTQGKVDIGRSFPVSLFEGIAKINGVRLISLQKNEGIEQLKSLPAGMKVELLPDDFDSGDNAFLDSAAVLKCVDLVITSDTALTHLSGALGVKTWLPLQYVPDWRWMLDRSDSPWYPNHRLFRQKTRGDWTGVFKEMENELKALVSTKHNKSI